MAGSERRYAHSEVSAGGRGDRINRGDVNFGDHGSAEDREAPRAAAADETTVLLLGAVRSRASGTGVERG
jgi:hypothetical protein